MLEQGPTNDASRPRADLVDVGLFSRVQQLIRSVRLTQDERVVVETGEVVSEVTSLNRQFSRPNPPTASLPRRRRLIPLGVIPIPTTRLLAYLPRHIPWVVDTDDE